MALINCPECGKEISDSTKICPLKLHSSYRTHYINHLAADRTGLL